MDIVIIGSAFDDDAKGCREYAQQCVRNSLLRGEAPFHAFLLYAYSVDPKDDAGQEAAVIAAKKFASMTDRVAIYVDKGIALDMRAMIAEANRLSVPVAYRSLKKPAEDLAIAHIAFTRRVTEGAPVGGFCTFEPEGAPELSIRGDNE